MPAFALANNDTLLCAQDAVHSPRSQPALYSSREMISIIAHGKYLLSELLRSVNAAGLRSLV